MPNAPVVALVLAVPGVTALAVRQARRAAALVGGGVRHLAVDLRSGVLRRLCLTSHGVTCAGDSALGDSALGVPSRREPRTPAGVGPGPASLGTTPTWRVRCGASSVRRFPTRMRPGTCPRPPGVRRQHLAGGRPSPPRSPRRPARRRRRSAAPTTGR